MKVGLVPVMVYLFTGFCNSKVENDNDKYIRDQNNMYIMTSQSCTGGNENGVRVKRSVTSSDSSLLIQQVQIWDSTVLSYKVYGSPASLTTDETRHAIYRAFRMWAKRSRFVFIETEDDDANIQIKFLSGDHGDGDSNAFDGEGGHLAHALLPPAGEIHFDADEWWAVSAHRRTAARGYKRAISSSPYSLVHVAAHEIGHVLGLHHSDVTESIMYPLYPTMITTETKRVRVHKSDAESLKLLYDGTSINTIPSRKKTTGYSEIMKMSDSNPNRYMSHLPPRYYGKQRTVKITPDPCDCTIDATYTEGDVIYIFSGRYFWTVNINTHEMSPVSKIRHKWPLLSKPRVDAAAYSTFSDRTYIFSGHKYWRLYHGELEYGYPRFVRNQGIPSSPDAVYSIPGTPNLYVFKKDKYFVFDELNEEVVLGYPKDIKELDENLKPKYPYTINSVLSGPGSKVYFIYDKMSKVFSDYNIWPELKKQPHQNDDRNLINYEIVAIFGKLSPINCHNNSQKETR